jgi:hypothetical protein
MIAGSLSLASSAQKGDLEKIKRNYISIVDFLKKDGLNCSSNTFYNVASLLIHTTNFNGEDINNTEKSYKQIVNFLKHEGLNSDSNTFYDLASILTLSTADNPKITNLNSTTNYINLAGISSILSMLKEF